MNEKDTSLTFRLSEKEKEMIKELAAKEDVTVSKLLYRIVFKELEEKNNGNGC